MLVQSTSIWELDWYNVGHIPRNALAKAYGSKRSGTVYLVADSEGEAIAVAKELFRMSGFVGPEKIVVNQTHLVKKAVRAIY